MNTVNSRNTRSNGFVTHTCTSLSHVHNFKFNDTQSGKFAKPTVKGIGEKSFVTRGVYLSNSLPRLLWDIPMPSRFKISVK